MATVVSLWFGVCCLLFAATDFVRCDDDDDDPTPLRVTTVLAEPFMMQSQEDQKMEGYIVDLLDILTERMNLKLTVNILATGGYGVSVGGDWTGMMGELEGAHPKADLAAAPLTKTEARGNVVDFIEPPLMTLDLAILMRSQDKTSEISDILSLGGQEKVKYGIIAGGSTSEFFGVAEDYAKMGSDMEADSDDCHMPTVAEGVRRVRESTDEHPFAFIGENVTLAYYASREPCELTVVPGGTGNAGRKTYALAVRKQLPDDVKTALHTKLTELKDEGKLDALYKKWWVDRSECNSAFVTSGTAAILVPIVAALLSRFGSE